MDLSTESAGTEAVPGAGPGSEDAEGEQRIVIRGVSWKDYCVISRSRWWSRAAGSTSSGSIRGWGSAKNSAFPLYTLAEEGYRRIEASELVPGLDFAELAGYAVRSDQHEAVVEFRDRLRAR
jgi:hypothetical protein